MPSKRSGNNTFVFTKEMRNKRLHFGLFFLFVILVVPSVSLPFVGEKALVTRDGVDLKLYPGIGVANIISIETGEAVEIINRLESPESAYGFKDHWYYVRYRGLEGWIFGAFLSFADPGADDIYLDVPSLTDRTNLLFEKKDSGELGEAVSLANEIIFDIESNFTPPQIKKSRRLSELVLTSLYIKGESLIYLGEFEESRETFEYLIGTYPEAELELDPITASEIVRPFLSFIEHYSNARVFENPYTALNALKGALNDRDLDEVSRLALPGIFELWVAHTDWVSRLGDGALAEQGWLMESWDGSWEILNVFEKKDENGEILGFCIETGPWEINYYGRVVDRVDFCIDQLAGSGYVFSYLIVYTTPDYQ
jgi:hypothetical protein